MSESMPRGICALSDILATSPDNLAKNRVMIAIEYKRSGLYGCEFYRAFHYNIFLIYINKV
jgi:hypothetical protein